MKFTCIFAVWISSGFTLNFENSEEYVKLCSAVKSILQLGMLTPPLNVQMTTDTFYPCLSSTHLTFLINFCDNETTWMSRSSIILVERQEDVSNEIFACMNHKGNHLIIIKLNSPNELNELVNRFWRKHLINVSFLVIGNTNVMLKTFIPYNEGRCNDTELITINQFDEKAQNWLTADFFPEKLDNFHKCSIKITTHKNIIPYIVREEYVNGQRVLQGRVIKMIDALAKSLNFTAEVDYKPSIAAWENCYQNVANNEADMFIGNVALDFIRIDYLDFSLPIFFEFLKFVIPPGRSYTQIENFSRVFDKLTWLLILSVLLLTALIILIVNLGPKSIQIYVFGARYRNAFMDFLSTIFGTTSSFIRTIYQGSLFNFSQSGLKVKPVQSINEMINNGYTFYMLQQYGKFLDLSLHTHISKRFIEISDFDEILEKISDSNFKGTLMHTTSLISYKNSLKNRNFTNLLCKEYLMTVSMVAYLRKNFYLTDAVNEKIGIFHTAGLIDVWDRLSKIKIPSTTAEEKIHKPIALSNITGMLTMYCGACAACIILFAVEIALGYLRK